MQNSGDAAGTINLTEVMDHCRIGPLQVRVFALCLASLIMDGFDVQAMGFVSTTMLRARSIVVETKPIAWTSKP